MNNIISVSIPTWLYLAMCIVFASTCATFLLKAIARIDKQSKRKDA